MKYTIKLSKKSAELYDKVYDTLDLVFGYALTEYVLYDGRPGDMKMILESDEDAECELDRILPEVGGILGVELSYESADGDGEDEEDEECEEDEE